MIPEFVTAWDRRKGEVEAKIKAKHPESYGELVRWVVEILNDDASYQSPDPERIVEIDHGEYQGTLVFVIAEDGYQPSTYWAVRVYYGSCSGCDTLQSISGYSDDLPTDVQVADYMTLALHVLQGIRLMFGDDEE